MSISSALGNGSESYQVLFFWGLLGISVVIFALLLVCTPLGNPLKRRLLCLGPKSSKSGQFNTPELEAHTFEFRSPHPVGTPAPPYEWVLRVTPPPPPSTHFPSPVAHIAPIVTHRFSDIPRVPSGNGLGIQMHEGSGEKHDIKVLERDSEKANKAHPDGSARDCSEVISGILVSEAVQLSPSRPLSAAEIGCIDGLTAAEGKREATQDRYRALLLQSNERSRRELLKSMSEEDRKLALAL